ncbi:MAG: lamin tail domain-containing protein [Thermoplasmata archaeon]|nr:lamin tail domain-containing protein [Thermoplasmata archaeon]
MNVKSRRGSKKGQMPLAMIAVALLISSTFFCVITKNIEDSTENTESLSNEIDALDEEIEHARLRIETNLGNLITDLSANAPDGIYDTQYASDNLIERARTFDQLQKRMFDTQFPSNNRGVTTDIIEHDIWLTMESVKLGIEENGTQSAFLRAMGTVTASFSTESTSTIRTLDIVADATSCLPLIVESATEFELSLEGSNSALAQMVDYQLTALAQNRVINGYGLDNLTGKKSTMDIITEDDVRRAIRNALDILETMNFRCNASGNNTLLKMTQIDLADYMVVEDGGISFDIGSFYAQAILSNIDSFAFSWMEYIGYDEVFEFIDSVWDIGRNAFNGIIGVFTGKDMNKQNVTGIISDRMKAIGARDDLVLETSKMAIVVPDMSYEVLIDDEPITIPIEGWTEIVYLDRMDALDWNGWGQFYKNYNKDRNILLDPLKDTIRSIANAIKGSCIVRIDVDCFDNESFLETVRSEILRCIENSYDIINDKAENATRTCHVTDPLFSAAYIHIKENRYDIFGLDRMSAAINDAHIAIVNRIVTEHPELHNMTQDISFRILKNIDINSYVEGFRTEIDKKIDELVSMNRVIKDNSNIIIDSLAFAIDKVLNKRNLNRVVENSMTELIDTMMEHFSTEPSFDIIELPGKNDYSLNDGTSGIHTEVMGITDLENLDVDIIDPTKNESKNIHYIGFDHLGNTTYSAIFDIKINGTIGFTVTSANTLVGALGTHDASYTGLCDVSLALEIPCISGWGLMGVDYKKSNTLINDVWAKILNLLKPLLDDIIELYRTIKDLENICSTAILEFGNRLDEMMTQIYEVISIPMELITDMMDRYLRDLLKRMDPMLEDIFLGMDSQRIVFKMFDITVMIETDLKKVFKDVKDIVKVTVSKEIGGLKTTAFCKISKKMDDFKILMGGGAEGDDWKFNISIDPLLSSGPYYVSITGNIRDIAYSGTLPEHVQYKKIELSLTDIPLMETILSNIPTPIPGIKCALDAGAYLKCGLPIEDGLIINEVELNPSGNDTGKEWVELYNNSNVAIDLTGYVLTPESGDSKSYTIDDVTIGPKCYEVIKFPKQTLNNSASKGLKGERVTLYDTYGNVVDVTGWLVDNENSTFTNQRASDAYAEWCMNKESPGSSNGARMDLDLVKANMILPAVEKVVPKVFDEMGGKLTTVEQVMLFLEKVLAAMIEEIIDTIANVLIEAYLFINVAFEEYTESLGMGLKMMIGLDSKIVSDSLRYLATMIPIIGEHINNPAGMSMEKILLDDVYLRTVIYTKMSAPKFMDLADLSLKVKTGLSTKINISAITTVLDTDSENSQWSAEVGIVMEGVPSNCIPPSFKPQKYYDHDLWLFKMTFSKMKGVADA